ncbi:hypothetical protein [Paenibacillus sp. Marseille-P2973]|uniref:hypothetical protein n=1 Tax=Paenibacillus sp. Marseille-P2973 TaxID=1871032 RepID=UPI001B359836|nr:hypothetical protein [Paenibacillus sp. Marseille-P2973]
MQSFNAWKAHKVSDGTLHLCSSDCPKSTWTALRNPLVNISGLPDPPYRIPTSRHAEALCLPQAGIALGRQRGRGEFPGQLQQSAADRRLSA